MWDTGPVWVTFSGFGDLLAICAGHSNDSGWQHGLTADIVADPANGSGQSADEFIVAPSSMPPPRPRHVLLVTVLIGLGALAIKVLSRSFSKRHQPPTRASASRRVIEPIALPEASPHSSRPTKSDWTRWCIPALAVAGTAYPSYVLWAAKAMHHNTSLVTALSVATLFVAAAGLRGPHRRYGRVVFGLLELCALFASTAVFSAVLAGSRREDGDLAVLFFLTLCGIAAVALIAWLASTWWPGRRGVEAIALLAMAVVLAAISLLGISTSSAPIPDQNAHGSGAVFASAPDVFVVLSVQTDHHEILDPLLTFTISTATPTAAATSARWALVLNGAGRVQASTLKGDGVSTHEVARTGPKEVPTQVVSGAFHNDRATTFIAKAEKPFGVRSASRVAVEFPTYRVGDSALDRWPTNDRRVFGGGDPRWFPPNRLRLYLSAGHLVGLETLTQVTPPLTVPNELAWQEDWSLSSYSTFDQRSDDVARNKMFAIAVFLGTAAACLVAAMQTALQMRHTTTN